MSPCQLIDGTPAQVRHRRRFRKGHLLLKAALSFCAAKNLVYYGFQSLAPTTPAGIIVGWDLLENCRDLSVLGDKGFPDQWRQGIFREEQGLLLLTPERRNQYAQNAPAWDNLINRMRRLVETTFAQAKDALGLEKLGARSVWGILSRVIAKITGLTVAAKHNREQGCSPLRLAEFSF